MTLHARVKLSESGSSGIPEALKASMMFCRRRSCCESLTVLPASKPATQFVSMLPGLHEKQKDRNSTNLQCMLLCIVLLCLT